MIVEAVVVELRVHDPPPILDEEEVVMVAVVRVAVELMEFVSPVPLPMLTVTVMEPLPLLHRKRITINVLTVKNSMEWDTWRWM